MEGVNRKTLMQIVSVKEYMEVAMVAALEEAAGWKQVSMALRINV